MFTKLNIFSRLPPPDLLIIVKTVKISISLIRKLKLSVEFKWREGKYRSVLHCLCFTLLRGANGNLYFIKKVEHCIPRPLNSFSLPFTVF